MHKRNKFANKFFLSMFLTSLFLEEIFIFKDQIIIKKWPPVFPVKGSRFGTGESFISSGFVYSRLRFRLSSAPPPLGIFKFLREI
jgi:hypothetical protein